MAAAEQAWTEVGVRFTALGKRLKERYAEEAGAQGAADTMAVEDSLHKLADALDHVFTSAGTATRDPAVAEDTRQAARSLGRALAATLDEVSQGLRDRSDRRAADVPNQQPGGQAADAGGAAPRT
jgi:endonuclease/exonuclease/phosphatase family metal-dependent hydrolase